METHHLASIIPLLNTIAGIVLHTAVTIFIIIPTSHRADILQRAQNLVTINLALLLTLNILTPTTWLAFPASAIAAYTITNFISRLSRQTKQGGPPTPPQTG